MWETELTDPFSDINFPTIFSSFELNCPLKTSSEEIKKVLVVLMLETPSSFRAPRPRPFNPLPPAKKKNFLIKIIFRF